MADNAAALGGAAEGDVTTVAVEAPVETAVEVPVDTAVVESTDTAAGIKTLIIVDVELSEESGSDVVARSETDDKASAAQQEVVLLAYGVVQLSTTEGKTGASSVCQGQLFIKPTASMPPPTAYYTSVTGIIQENLDQGTTLKEALDTLHEKLSSYMDDQSSVCMLTDGDKDINEWLSRDASRQGIELRGYFKRSLDLRKEFPKWKPDVQGEIATAQMLKTLGMEAAGEKNCGETEVTNITTVINAMVEAGYTFAHTAPTASSAEKTQVIRLRGLPFQITKEELLEFLKTVEPDADSLHICRGPAQRPTGDAFVRIPPHLLDAAVKLSGERVGHRYAEVFGTTELEMTDAIKRSEAIAEEAESLSTDSLSQRGPFDMVVKLRGMPFSASPSDIAGFFIGVTIPLNNIHICRRMDGRPNGDAFVQLQGTEEVERCLSFDRKNLGSRYVEVFRSTQSDMLTALGVGTNMGATLQGGVNGDTLTLRMQGLPFTATEADVHQFFSGLQIAPNGVSFRMNRDGRPSGVAYCTFSTQQQFEDAKTRNRSMMGSRYVELFPCSAMEIPRNQGMNGGGYGGGNQQQQGRQQLPATYQEYQQQRQQHRMQWETYHQQAKAYYDQNGYGAQYQQFYEQQQRQFQQTDQQAEAFYRNQAQGGQAAAFGGAGYAGGYAGGYGGASGTDAGGIFVRMKGLPYTSTPVEIAEFFNGYNVGVDDVQIVLNNDGRPSGDANVRFPDSASAQTAVSQLNRQTIGSRYIELFMEGRR